MNSNKDTEIQIQVFSPDEILNKDKKSKKKLFSDSGNNVGRTRLFFDESQYKRGVMSLWTEFRNHIISCIATVLVAITLCFVVNQLNWGLGYEVFVDGENIGMVMERQVVFDAIDEVRDSMVFYFGDETSYEKEPVFVRRIVDKDELASKEDMKNSLFSNINAMTRGYVAYIDGVPVFGVADEAGAKWVLEQYMKNAVGEVVDGVSVDFCENVEIRNEYMSYGMLKTPEKALAVVSEPNREISEYIVEESDTIWIVAERFDTTVERILALNKGISSTLVPGDSLKVEKTVPRLSVRCVETVSMNEPVPYKIEKIDDSSIYEGRTVISQEGKNGVARVVATVTTINGVQTDKKVLSSETVAEPVTQIEKVGTKERPATTGSGTFENPTSGNLSSRYGARWNRSHNGIDITGAYNTPINAADGGIVTYADWMDGYGNYVIIDHENGYQTAYAHCASIEVSVGNRVAKGELIARMGSTGRSTGTHLHFEVKKDGVFVNPLEYVGY